MAKRLPENQRFDRDYIQWNMRDFFTAIAEENAEKAEEIYNEITGTMWAMMGRITGE